MLLYAVVTEEETRRFRRRFRRSTALTTEKVLPQEADMVPLATGRWECSWAESLFLVRMSARWRALTRVFVCTCVVMCMYTGMWARILKVTLVGRRHYGTGKSLYPWELRMGACSCPQHHECRMMFSDGQMLRHGKGRLVHTTAYAFALGIPQHPSMHNKSAFRCWDHRWDIFLLNSYYP